MQLSVKVEEPSAADSGLAQRIVQLEAELAAAHASAGSFSTAPTAGSVTPAAAAKHCWQHCMKPHCTLQSLSWFL